MRHKGDCMDKCIDISFTISATVFKITHSIYYLVTHTSIYLILKQEQLIK